MGRIILPGHMEPIPEPREIYVMEPSELRELVRQTLARNAKIPRPNPLQKRLDDLAADFFADNDIEMCAALLHVNAARAANVTHYALEALMQMMIELMPTIAVAQRCRACGCRNGQPCPEGCDWVSIDLCSRCAGE
jgi:hypothetical protein